MEEKKREKRTKEGNGRRERRTWKAEKEAEEGKRRMGVNGARRWKFRARVKCRQAQPAGCSRCNDLENSASGVNVSKPASCGRAHVPSSGAHARARAISWKRSLARQRRVTMTSEATWTVAACARQTWKVLFFTPLPTHARTHTTPVDRIHRGDLWPRMNLEGSSGFIGSRWKKNRVQCSLSSGYGEGAWTRKRNFSFYFILFFNRRE